MKFPRPRFSLRTLVIAALLAGSGIGLWHEWQPWQLVARYPDYFNGANLAFSPDGKWLAVGASYSNDVSIYDVQARIPVFAKTIRADGNGATWLAFSPDNLHLVFASGQNKQNEIQMLNNEKVEYWDIRGPERVSSFAIYEPLHDLRFSYGDILVRVRNGVSRAVSLWKLPESELRLRVGGMGDIQCWGAVDEARLSETRVKLAALHPEAMKVGSLDEFAAMTQTALKDAYWTDGLLFVNASPDGRTLITYLAEAPAIQLWDLGAGKKVADIQYNISPAHPGAKDRNPGHREQDLCWCAVSPNRTKILTVRRISDVPTDYIYEVRDVATQGIIQTFHDSGEDNYEFYGDEWLTYNNTLHYLATNEEFPNVGTPSPDVTRGVLTMDPAAAFLVSLPGSHFLCELERTCSGAAFSPDSSLLATTADDGVFFRRRIRPEAWWGIAWLPLFWTTVVLSVALAWSVRRDWRRA